MLTPNFTLMMSYKRNLFFFFDFTLIPTFPNWESFFFLPLNKPRENFCAPLRYRSSILTLYWQEKSTLNLRTETVVLRFGVHTNGSGQERGRQHLTCQVLYILHKGKGSRFEGSWDSKRLSNRNEDQIRQEASGRRGTTSFFVS